MVMEEQVLLVQHQIIDLQEAIVKVIHSDKTILANTYLLPGIENIYRKVKMCFGQLIRFINLTPMFIEYLQHLMA